MSCYSCSAGFGILRKEVGCESCGFSFCGRCCKKREVPSKTGELIKQIVCNKCCQSISNNQAKTGRASPPLAHKKRMEALKKQSFSVDSASDMSSLQKQWSNEKDKEIAERLQKLKKDRIKDTLPSEDEIAERLAKLKGMDPTKYKAPPIQVYRPPNLSTATEQASDLMKQMTLEVELDSRLVKPEDEIAARLAALRDEVPKKEMEIEKPVSDLLPSDNQMHESPPEEMDIESASSQLQEQCKSLSGAVSEDVRGLYNDPEYKKLMMDLEKEKDKDNEAEEEEEANKLVEKLLAADVEAEELDSLNDDTEDNSKSDKETTEEFPWCVICTEDAKIRCFGCDSDLYCMGCFKECHDSLEIKDHKTCPYFAPKSPAL